MASSSRLRTSRLLAVLLLLAPLAGCVDQAGLPRVQVTIGEEQVRWGQAAQLTIQNVGDGPAPAPLEVHVESTNGTVVRTFADVTGGRGLPAGGQLSLHWNGTNDQAKPVLWGTYTFRLPAYQARAPVELLPPPQHAMTVDAVPRTQTAGEPVQFVVNNTGTTWINGTLTVAAGRQDQVLYTNEVDVQLAPGQGWTFNWNGKTPNGTTPEAQKYLIAARVEPDQGPTPFAQDVFELTAARAG